VLGLVAWVFFSCREYDTTEEEKPLAKVHDDYLYLSDIRSLFNENMTVQDSMEILESYVDKWVRKKLMLNVAEEYLPENQKDVQMELEDYRSKLIIYKYEQRWMKENLDTVVSVAEIAEYYDAYSSNFILDKPILQGRYIQVPKVSPNIENLRKWCRSDDNEDLNMLEDYCYEYAQVYDTFTTEWVPFQAIMLKLPRPLNRVERYLEGRRDFIQEEDSLYYYFVKILDLKQKSEVAPLSYVQDEIKMILLNKRKLQLIDELENEVYNEALNRGNFKIYE
jgi:hypothetical protein